jgi:hypothetical protein
MTDRMPPRPEPEQDRDLEEQLRTVLAFEAAKVDPTYRLAEIRSAALRESSRPRWRGWMLPLVAAASVAALALGWLGLRPPPAAAPPPVPAGTVTTAATPSGELSSSPPVTPSTSSATASATPSSIPNGAGTTSATASASVSAATTAVALPVYYVAPPANADGRFSLVRQFQRAFLPANAPLADRANAALNLALQVPNPNDNRFVSAWAPGTTARWVQLPDPELGVSLSRPGLTGLPADAQRLAVQALVWTVTAVAQRDAPVQVTVASGGGIFETVGTNVFKRPAADRAFEEIAPIWVDTPSPGARLSAAAKVQITGQACVFEATVAWELRRNGAVVQKGSTSAAQACPNQSPWSLTLEPLSTGDYEFAAIEYSAKDGSVAFENDVPFSVG